MGFCTGRYFFLSICLLQIVAVVERQVFDFLGFLWIPILVNFFGIIFIIFGFFGAYQYRPKYLIAYLLWQLFWLGWNIFLICLYLDVAGLEHKKNKVLKLDPKSDSWWKREGPDCKVKNVDATPVEYEGCLINYIHVEIFQAGLQCFLAFLNSIIGICLSRTFLEEDDTSLPKRARKPGKQRTSLYSIEFSSQSETRLGDDMDDLDRPPPPVSPKPMTPRRVKRRSVMTRGSPSRHSSRRSRSSTRNSRRNAQNPVTRLLEQQQKCHAYDSPVESPLPAYYAPAPNNNNHMANQKWQGGHVNINASVNGHSHGHANPTYQQSSQQSLNEVEDLDELYNNRPASVRSSYSNFHGTRALSYSPPRHYHGHATPQVPQKRVNPNRASTRSVAFLSTGPPAYVSQARIPVDSETPI